MTLFIITKMDHLLIKKIIDEKSHMRIIIKMYYQKYMIGILYAIYQFEDCYIADFNVNEEYQNKGYGSLLMEYLIDHCKENNIRKIILDDMSDRFNQEHNIYLKFGFKYISNNFPEMELIFNL